MDQQNHNPEKRRPHSHRSRRGSDRRGFERRGPQPPADRPPRDQVDVEQIMGDIRSRIAQRQGIDLSTQQIQDLAARRLESILDPRAIKPSLLDGLRRSAAATTAIPRDKVPNEPAYSFEDTTIYDSHRGSLRFIRRLLNPLLKLFFNPNPLIRALHLQAGLNVEAAEREAERDRRQTEWNALHYEILQRLVTDVSRVSLEVQAQTLQIESLGAKVDFNDRRVRGLEGALHRGRAAGRPVESETSVTPPVPEVEAAEPSVPPTSVEGVRRRRRRRRGRRSGGSPTEGPGTVSAAPSVAASPDVHAPLEAQGLDREPVDFTDETAPPVAIATPTERGERDEHVHTNHAPAADLAPPTYVETPSSPTQPAPAPSPPRADSGAFSSLGEGGGEPPDADPSQQ